MEAASVTKDGPKMMMGTEGKFDYLVIARRGDIALGVKPNFIKSGRIFGQDGTVWFGARLRSASAEGLFEDDPDPKVVKLEKKPESFGAAWPNVVWEKEDNKRASTTIGVLLRGRLDGTVEEANLILKQMKNGEIAKQMADYLYNLVGEQYMILTRDQIAQWLTDTVYSKVAMRFEKSIKKRMAFEEEMGKNIGTFGMQAQILKKAYEKVQAEYEEAEDLDDEGNEED